MNEEEYRDEDYSWFKMDMNQTQDNISAYSSANKNNRRQRILNKQDQSNKSFTCAKNSTKCVWNACLKNFGNTNKAQSNSRNWNKNAVNMTNWAPQFSFKSKMKKRLKFTMRNDKQKQNKLYDRKASKDNRMFEINDFVSIVGFNSRIHQANALESEDHRIIVSKPHGTTFSQSALNATNEVPKRTKSENRNSKIKSSSANKPDLHHSQTTTHDIKKTYWINIDNNSPEKTISNPHQLHPPLLRWSAQSDGEKSAGLRKY